MFGFLLVFSGAAQANSLKDALAMAYEFNPTLKAERANLRAIDEGVPQALAGRRPTISGSADIGYQDLDIRSMTLTGPARSRFSLNPRGYSITLSQPIFAGFTVLNSIRQAEALVKAGAQALKNTEQNILFDAAQVYMDVVRDIAIIDLQRNNLRVLKEQLRATHDRFSVGEVTRTDVAQAEASVALADSGVSLANANLATSRAVYEQIVGQPPNGVRSPPSIEGMLPNNLDSAIAIGETEHPAILAASFSTEAASHQVEVARGSLLPSVDLEASYSNRYDSGPTTTRSEAATLTGRLTVPLYQRGAVSSRIRQSRQTLAQSQFQVEQARHQVRAAVASAWNQLQSIKAQQQSNQAQVRANEIALNGVREESSVGQRTVLDVLDAEQNLLNSRVTSISTNHDRVVASYAVLVAIGRLNNRRLALNVQEYNPEINYRNVRNRIFGIGIPLDD
ncbi:MAG: TolC family outer membrane protein [Rhizobiales bacterium]|nr:TolC family outer membrane protein [Hyphomicrobiales bacterium]